MYNSLYILKIYKKVHKKHELPNKNSLLPFKCNIKYIVKQEILHKVILEFVGQEMTTPCYYHPRVPSFLPLYFGDCVFLINTQ